MSGGGDHFAGIVHRGADDVLSFDGTRTPDTAMRGRHLNGTIWYTDATVRPSDIARILRPGDEAIGPAPGVIRGARVRTDTSSYQLVSGESWGVHRRDPNVAHHEIRTLRALAAAAGMRVKPSAATTSINTYLDRWDGDLDHPAVCQLPSRWRAMAHAAFHGGPIAVLGGGAEHAVQIDVHRAYLDALYTPIPVLGTTPGGKTGGYEAMEPGVRWNHIRRREGFVDAIVEVHTDPTSLPPLPVSTRGGILYPNGRIRGCWVISQVREAEARGSVTVHEIRQAIVARQLRPLFAEVADFFSGLPKQLAQISYQRYWARWGNPGGYIGMRRDQPEPGETPAHGLWWHYDGVKTLDTNAPRTYRPDISAIISAVNQRRVIRAIHQDLAIGSVIATHVDAIWTTDAVGAKKICDRSTGVGGWRVKREGPLRFWATGCYDHAGDIAASGYDAATLGPVTRDRVEKWIHAEQGFTRKSILNQRAWTSDPGENANATSTALTSAIDTNRPVTHGPNVYDPIWTQSGWARPDYRPATPSWARATADLPADLPAEDAVPDSEAIAS